MKKSEVNKYIKVLEQRKQVYDDYAKLNYSTDVLSPNRLYVELGDEVATIIAELGQFVKEETKDGNKD
jgi:hypothetical protein